MVIFFIFSEAKLDNSFPVAHFEISGYTTPYRNGDEILLCIREDIVSKTLHDSKVPMEKVLVEIKLV